jgi:hypothetical protein
LSGHGGHIRVVDLDCNVSTLSVLIYKQQFQDGTNCSSHRTIDVVKKYDSPRQFFDSFFTV